MMYDIRYGIYDVYRIFDIGYILRWMEEILHQLVDVFFDVNPLFYSVS